MDCGAQLVKYILFLFNALCSVFGILMVVFGVMTLNSTAEVRLHGHVGPETVLPFLLIVLGSIIVFISFLGCCGAIRESYCMSMMYATLLLLLLIVQLIVVVALWTHRKEFLNGVAGVIDAAWKEEAREAGFMAAFERSLHCCGRNGPQDYVTISKLPPSSCCEFDDCLNPLNIYLSGCRSKFVDFWSGKSDTIRVAGLILISVEVVGIIFGCCLANNIRNYKRRAAY